MFASCANPSDSDSDNNSDNNTGIIDNNNDSDDENPSPSLPANVGENPIKETIRLKADEDSAYYFELKTDGTACYIDEDDGKAESEYKYTYNEEAKTITMKLEKRAIGDSKEIEDFTGTKFEEGYKKQLRTYEDICFEINKKYTVEKIKKAKEESFEKNKDREKFREEYPDCDTYEKYEAAFLKKDGFESLTELVEYEKQGLINKNKAIFGAQITYAYEAYEFENDKMTLTEKFTGVKNLVDSECSFDGKSNYAYIDCLGASVEEDDVDYSGTVDTDKKTIIFKPKKGGEKVTATYTENISAGTVTIKFKGNEYVCKFEGEVYTQVE